MWRAKSPAVGARHSFGGAVDNEKAYFGLISSGHLALDLKTGEEVWYVPIVPPQGRESQRGVVGAVTLIPGVLLSGARDGMIRAASSRTGQLLWEFDSAQEFKTVNGIPARGGSAASGGPIVANGMVFIGSGYPGFQGASREMSSLLSPRRSGSTCMPMS